MKKYLFLLALVLGACSGGKAPVEPDTSGFKELCRQKGGTVEVAGDVYCTLDYDGDGGVDSSEYCSYTDFTAGECNLDPQ
jgi:hypothetical protein